MPIETRGRADQALRAIKKALQKYDAEHPDADIVLYRQNSASIRIRIIEPGFAGMSKADRHDQVWTFLAGELPDDVQTQITVLLLLTPDETRTSFANLEFDHPLPSRL